MAFHLPLMPSVNNVTEDNIMNFTSDFAAANLTDWLSIVLTIFWGT